MNIRNLSVPFLLLVLYITSFCAAAQEPTMRFYVRPGGDDEADGLSWETAFANPQAAATAVESLFVPWEGQVYEVWLAAGTYTRLVAKAKEESTPTGVVEIGSLVSISFYGGYSGVEQYRDDRSWTENVVILDGGGEHACFAMDTLEDSGDCGKATKQVVFEDGMIIVDGITLQNATDAFFSKGDVCVLFRHCILRDNARSVYGCCGVMPGAGFVNSLILGPGGSIELSGCEPGAAFRGSTVVGVTGVCSVCLGGGGGHSSGALINSVIWDCAPLDFGLEPWVNVENTCLPLELLEAIPYVNATDTIHDDPQFVDAANGDYRLQETSPCVDTGIALQVEGASQDLLGIARPQGLEWDVGAYEYRAPDPGTEYHTADQNQDGAVNLSELLRVVQFRNSDGYHCEPGTEDGYAPGPGDQTCSPHQSDYNPANWAISLSELLRLIQFYNSGAYHACPGEGTEDGYCVGFSK